MNRIESLEKSIEQWERIRNHPNSSCDIIKDKAMVLEEMIEDGSIPDKKYPESNCLLCSYVLQNDDVTDLCLYCPMYGHWPSTASLEKEHRCMSPFSVYTSYIMMFTIDIKEYKKFIDTILNAMKDRLSQLKGE